jgi:hypothetical protein
MQGAKLKRARVSGEYRLTVEGALQFQRCLGLYTESVGGNARRSFRPANAGSACSRGY